MSFVQRILKLHNRWIYRDASEVIFGDLETSDIALDVPADWGERKFEDYLVRLREGQSMTLRATQDNLKKKSSQKMIRW